MKNDFLTAVSVYQNFSILLRTPLHRNKMQLCNKNNVQTLLQGLFANKSCNHQEYASRQKELFYFLTYYEYV